MIYGWVYCRKPFAIAKEVIKNANNKKIMALTDQIESVIVYTSKENIDKLKTNMLEYQEKIERQNYENNNYERYIRELEETNERLSRENELLQEQLDN